MGTSLTTGSAYAVGIGGGGGCITQTCPSDSATPTPTASTSTTATPTPTDTDAKPTAGAEPTATDTASSDPTPTDPAVTPVTGAATVGGKFTLGDGTALANFPVTISAVDATPTDGTTTAPEVVGTATTAADGSWTFTLPDPLPAALQALADANSGVLNLEADATGPAPDGTVMTAADFMSAGVAEGAATTLQSANARASATTDTVALMPLPASTADATPPTDAQAANSTGSLAVASNNGDEIDAAPPLWQNNTGASTAGYNPEVVNGVDYSSVTPDRSIPCASTIKALRTGIYYTTVGEAHANWDATATFDYSSKLSSTWSVAISSTGSDFKESGSYSKTNSTGHEITRSGGPYWAYQIKIPIEYVEDETIEECGGIVDSRLYKILPVGYDVPAGGALDELGADVSSHDGSYQYIHDSNPNYRAIVPRDSTFSLAEGTSTAYGTGVSAFGVSLTVTSTYDSSHYEKIAAGVATNGTHYIWGLRAKVTGNPGVFYSD